MNGERFIPAGQHARTTGLLSAVVAGAVEIDRATVNLLALLGPAVGHSHIVDAVTDEVERRARLFADLRTASPRAGEHPRLAALRSVTADMLAGRFQ